MHRTHRDQIEPLVADHGEIIRELAGPGHSLLARHSLAEIRLLPVGQQVARAADLRRRPGLQPAV